MSRNTVYRAMKDGNLIHKARKPHGITKASTEIQDKENLSYDNARMESFFATLKKEKLYQIPTYRMKKEEVKTIVFRYIFIYYNRIRLYTGNPGCLPPSECRIRDREKTVA